MNQKIAYFRLEFETIFLPKMCPLLFAPELRAFFSFKNNWLGQFSGFLVENEEHPL